jgi:hypothetical protein
VLSEYFIHFSREPVFQNVFDNLRLAVLGDYGGFALSNSNVFGTVGSVNKRFGDNALIHVSRRVVEYAKHRHDSV